MTLPKLIHCQLLHWIHFLVPIVFKARVDVFEGLKFVEDELSNAFEIGSHVRQQKAGANDDVEVRLVASKKLRNVPHSNFVFQK